MRTIPSAILLLLLSGTISSAQDAQQSSKQSNEPESEHQRVEILTDTLPRMGTNETPIEPSEPDESSPHETGLTEGQDWMQVVNNAVGTIERPSSLAEGSFIISRTGRLVPAPNDRLIFVPAIDQRLPGEGPVLLLPCNALERLESIWANQPVTVSGEILSYHGRNHLLISDFTLGLVMPVTQPVQTTKDKEAETESDSESTDETTQGLDEDPDVMDLLRELDEESSAPSGAQISTPLDSRFTSNRDPQPSQRLQTAPPELVPGIREGTLMIRRPARLDRAADGSWMAIFDNDDPEAPIGMELTILPCSLLMTMEHQALAFGDTSRFVISGRIYVHNKRGYLLPTFYQRLRTSDIQPWQ